MSSSGNELLTDILTSGAATEASSAPNNTAIHDVVMIQFLSGPLQAQTIGGTGWTVKGQFLVQENNNDANFQAQMVIRVLSNDGTTVRGTLLAADTTALGAQPPEFAQGTHTNRKFPLSTISPAALAAVTASANDRLCVEIGYRSHNASSASNRNASARYGSGPRFTFVDLPENETDSTQSKRPWIEFSNTISEAEQERRLTLVAGEAVAYDTSVERRLTLSAAEAMAYDTSDERRLSFIAAEVMGINVPAANYMFWSD